MSTEHAAPGRSRDDIPIPLPVAVELARTGYTAWIATTGLAERSKDTYRERVEDYLSWLAATGDDQHVGALAEARTRDCAVRDYRRHLLSGHRRGPPEALSRRHGPPPGPREHPAPGQPPHPTHLRDHR
ncbi:hypothetical protein [Streptomonospora salina]|uniref:Core-binding (CB) domain-containing protein n=1 Tax=Streptomonospora salina TaxID=104205 RepID=A0A841E0Q8_9ACTN|nr:hypothetical protein [Streptomonospora salina]MBB5996262.1 hypothetical protein [Streptomonospora salina]